MNHEQINVYNSTTNKSCLGLAVDNRLTGVSNGTSIQPALGLPAFVFEHVVGNCKNRKFYEKCVCVAFVLFVKVISKIIVEQKLCALEFEP